MFGVAISLQLEAVDCRFQRFCSRCPLCYDGLARVQLFFQVFSVILTGLLALVYLVAMLSQRVAILFAGTELLRQLIHLTLQS